MSNSFTSAIRASLTNNGVAIGWSQASAAQNTFYDITDADIVAKNISGITDTGSGVLTIVEAGLYLVSYSITCETSAANVHLIGSVAVGGVERANGQGHTETKFLNQETQINCTGLFNFAAGAVVNLSVATTDAGTPNITVETVNLTMLKISE